MKLGRMDKREEEENEGRRIVTKIEEEKEVVKIWELGKNMKNNMT